MKRYATHWQRRQRFTSAGGERMWETFSLPEPIEIRFLLITAVEGPADVPSGYPTLKVGDFRVVGDTTESPAGTFQVSKKWRSLSVRVMNTDVCLTLLWCVMHWMPPSYMRGV